MAIKQLPAAPAVSERLRTGVRSDITPSALGRWDRSIQAASSDDSNTISIFDVIGADPWTGDGVTAKRIGGALRAMSGPVTVSINSPGGDMFEGLAIYNLLREYPGAVTVKVLGLAASAASVIAMAGDEVQIARAGFLMIHNAWVYTAGNRNALREVADTLEPFDRAMADIYATRTGDSLGNLQAMMDAETYLGGSDAVARGFADGLLPADQVTQDAKARHKRQAALAQLEQCLADFRMPAEQRRALLQTVAFSGDAVPAPARTPTPLASFHAALFGLSVAAAHIPTGDR